MLERIKNTNEEKICSFYASDYHFEMISLPYIEKEIKNNNEVTILTENNLEETIQKVLACTNLGEEEKKNIIKIGWNTDAQEKLDNLKKNLGSQKIIFIKGSKDYIKNMQNQIESNDSNMKIIHCYPIEEVEGEIKDITNNYTTILNTIGKIDM